MGRPTDPSGPVSQVSLVSPPSSKPEYVTARPSESKILNAAARGIALPVSASRFSILSHVCAGLLVTAMAGAYWPSAEITAVQSYSVAILTPYSRM